MAIPTLKQLYDNIANDLKNKLNLSDDNLKKALDAFAVVLAGQLKLAYLGQADILNNIFPDTADSSANGGTLDRLGLIYLNRIQRPATSGVFNITVTGEIGSVLRAGLTFKSNDDALNPGQLYILDNEFTLSDISETVEIRSVGVGEDYKLENSDLLTITEPVIGVNQTVTVLETTTDPLAAEADRDFRQAILDSIQLEPQGGAKTDYRLWALDAQGVRKVYPYVKDGEAGTVQVYVESTSGDGTPSAPLLTEVEEVITLDPDETKSIYERGRLPIQATLEVLPIVTNPVDVTITGLNENDAEITANITAALEDYLYNVRPFVAGGELSRDKNNILNAAKIQSVVSDVIGSDNYFSNLTMFVNGVQHTSYLFSRENIPYLRDLIFD